MIGLRTPSDYYWTWAYSVWASIVYKVGVRPKNLKPYFVELSQIIISDEVNHWMQVVADWKQLLGNEWNNTYGVVMYIDTRPQNNILLGILAHYMDSNAIWKQLFYFTADTYSPTAAQAIQLLAKATPDKVLAEEVYGEYYLSYSQILGQRARAAMKFYQTPHAIGSRKWLRSHPKKAFKIIY